MTFAVFCVLSLTERALQVCMCKSPLSKSLRSVTDRDVFVCPHTGRNITTTSTLMQLHSANPQLARYVHACVVHTDRDYAELAGTPIAPEQDGRRRYVPA